MRPPAHFQLCPPASASRWRAQAGFSIIEVLVAALIVMLLGAGVAGALVSQTRASADQQLSSQARLLVNQDQDRLRGLTDQTLSGMAGQGSSSRTVSATGTSFVVTSTVFYQSSSGQSTCASSTVDSYRIDTKVSWSAIYGGPANVASADSVLARPVIGVLQTTVVNQLGAAVSGASVIATPTGTTTGSAQSGMTDASGCTVFAGLAAGTYTVAATDSGYVSTQNQNQASSSATVSSNGTTAQASLVLGLAGTLTASFGASASTAPPTYPGQADGLTYTGVSSASAPPTNLQTTSSISSHSTTLIAGQTSITTTASLFPWYSGSSGSPSYQKNYTAYAGQCSFQNPFPTGSSTTNLASVSPGGAASATIQEPFLYLGSVQASGTQITPRDIVLTYSSGNCTDQYAPSVATSSGGGSYYGVTYGQPVPTNGWLVDPGQPYAPSGDLTVCVDVLANGAYFDGTATVANTSLTGENVVPTITVNTNQQASCPGITS